MAESYPVLEGAEAFHFPGNEIGVLLQHGFTGTTQSMRGLGENLAREGYTVYGPRLKGHGTHYEDMEKTTFQDWIDSTETGYRLLQETCSKIFVVGLSMGGALATHLAHRYPDTEGLVLINAVILNDGLKDALHRTEPRFLDAIGSDIKQEGIVELAYERTPLQSIKELYHLISQTQSKVSEIACPTLIFSSTEDHVVPAINQTYFMEHLGTANKQLIVLEDSYHVATLDNDKERIYEETSAFIKRLL